MATRIEVTAKHNDTRASVKLRELKSSGFNVESVRVVDVYTVDADFSAPDSERVASILSNPVLHEFSVNSPAITQGFDWAVEIGFLPGVTDNVAATAKETIEDFLSVKLSEGSGVYSSQLLLLSGALSKEDVERAGRVLANELIQRIHVKSSQEFSNDQGMGVVIPRVKLDDEPVVDEVDLNVSDEELAVIGKQGILDKDGSRRGPLALDLTCMKAIQKHFKDLNRKPTDIELESIAQTWSEHCKHTIFADPLDEVKDGIFNEFIKGATDKIRREKGDADFCVSVFKDNSGAIEFDDEFLVTHKAETHNSPSALDPFGGSITGIVGVNRDAIGCGLGSKPVINVYGYCFADPANTEKLFKGANKTQEMLSSKRIMQGVIEGVNVGGNCSGIPTPQGFMVFDERYKGKPLVFVGTVGLLPRKSAGRPSHEKQARPGDLIVVVGGRVGQDGIHGATFSSEAMDSGSPATAVQIGDPITQKKLSDALVKEARDKNLYTSITDNGAGGISCSVAEMAKECGGCIVDLEKVPLKYPGLEPWKTWISESQERMTLSVPKSKWPEFKELMDSRGVEAVEIGEFNDSGNCVVNFKGKTIMDLDMDFLHDGVPVRPLKTTYTKQALPEPEFEEPAYNQALIEMVNRLNTASFEFISQQYDHEVQGGSVLKPLQGRGRVNAEASVTTPVLTSKKGVVLSQGINPQYSDIDTYHMAACAIDTAVRNAVSAGASLETLALLDNFCWCSSNEPERLGQLKEAARACYDYSVAYHAPFISGKDSMFNDFKGFNEAGEPVKISVPPTLLVSSISVIDDASETVSIDVKAPGDLVYVLGETKDELGASEYYALMGEKVRGEKFIGSSVPRVNAEKNKALYKALSKAIKAGLIASSQSVTRGGLGVALAKTSMSGLLGLNVSLQGLKGSASRNDFALFSESQGRIVVTVNPEFKDKFEDVMKGNAASFIGEVSSGDEFIVKGLNGESLVRTKVGDLLKSYKSRFKGF